VFQTNEKTHIPPHHLVLRKGRKGNQIRRGEEDPCRVTEGFSYVDKTEEPLFSEERGEKDGHFPHGEEHSLQLKN